MAIKKPAPLPLSSLTQQALKYISEAEFDRNYHLPWQRDVYRFCMPWRKRPHAWRQVHDQDDLFDSTAIEALSDFSADMQTTFTPVEEDWLDVEPAQSLGGFNAAQLAKPLKDYQSAIFSEIRRSNFHEASQETYPDLGTGTMAMILQDVDINQPIQCQAIPITDLLIVRGVFGGVDFRCRCIDNMKLRDVQPTYPKATLPQQLKQKIASDPGGMVKVRECFWRLWDQPGVERWQYVLLIDGAECQSDILEGPGSCPILVARWRTDSTTAWGIGALYVVLPFIKTLDQLCYLILKHLSFAVDPAGFYDDDGVINLDNGLEPGTMIPRQAGSKIEPYESKVDFNTSFFERKEMQEAIKRALFQNKPVQSGDTPPTAAQWMDQKAEIARRMGAPIGRLTTEWQWALFQRFAFLLARRGTVPKVNLQGKEIHLRAQSPLIKAQRQQSVVVGERTIQAITSLVGPQIVPLVIDVIKTGANIKDRLGDTVVELRSDADIQNIVQAAAQAAQQAGMLPGSGQGPPGPPQAKPPGAP